MASPETENSVAFSAASSAASQQLPASSATNEIIGNSPPSRREEATRNNNPPSRQSASARDTTTIRAPTIPSVTNSQQQPTNNNNGEFPQAGQNLFHMRDRLFLALFFRVSLIYARAFPKTLRRFIEFCLLMQSIILLFILGYIHVVYTQTPITCLSEYKNSWPKDGILRVEITTDTSIDYDISKSYEKEERLRQRAAASQMGQYSDDLLTMMLTADTVLLDRVVTTAGELLNSVTSNAQGSKDRTGGDVTTPPVEGPLKPSESSPLDTAGEIESEAEVTFSDVDDNVQAMISKDGNGNDIDEPAAVGESIETVKPMEFSADEALISPSFAHTASGEGSSGPASDGLEIDTADPDSIYFNKTFEEIEAMKLKKKNSEEETILKSSVSDFEMFANSVWLQDHAYIVEYALEYGFLRLSPDTRKKLNIQVKIVTLDPSKQACFGDTFSRFLLDNFLGYDDILMASIKNLAESEENKGYLRNVVTGEQFRFVPMWMARSAYIPSLLIMLVFTVSISMLLRYSHHQIFVFIVDLLNNIEGAGAIHIPAAPLFTVILALVGMEAIMSEFFNDTSTAFYVILIVWIADQYDSVCSHTQITRTYWVRFFYLYHFAFYAYHYRFNGQYGGLALLVSWSFIQHSMVYFYHHYELPTILRQAHISDDVRNPSRSPTPPPAPAPNNPVARSETGNITANLTSPIQTGPTVTPPTSDFASSSGVGHSSINNGSLSGPAQLSRTFTSSQDVPVSAVPHSHPRCSSSVNLDRNATGQESRSDARTTLSFSDNFCVSSGIVLNAPSQTSTLRHRSGLHPPGGESHNTQRATDVGAESDDDPD